jgi:Ca-activated chloride channel family protein
MRFGAGFWLAIGPAIVAGLGLLWWGSDRQAGRALAAVFRTPLLGMLLGSVGRVRRFGKRVLLGVAVLAVGLALARPQWGRSEITIERAGIDLVVALDVSRSMLAPDAGGTHRLAAARLAVSRLAESIGGDRLGLVVFAGEAFVAAPLTRDPTAFARALDAAGPASVSEGGSNLGAAIQRARDCFERGARGARVLLVVSDGEQLQGEAVVAAQGSAATGLRVHTAGVGSATGARLPGRSGGTGDFLRNPAGREVVSRRDEQRLERIAAAGGGRYTRIERSDGAALVEWFRSIAAGLPRSVEKRLVDEPRERFQWPLALALALLAGEWLTRDRRRRRVGDGEPKAAQGADIGVRPKGAMAAAVGGTILCAALAVETAAAPTAPLAYSVYNAGVAEYAAGRFQAAFDRWQELALGPLPRGLRDPVSFQLGNVQFRLGEPLEGSAPEQAAEWWRRSLEAYRTVLGRSPRHATARHNYDFVRERLARLVHRLGLELFRAAEGKPLDAAIDLLQSSLDPLREAVGLEPDDVAIRRDRDQAAAALRQRLAERAAQAETAGDREVARNSESSDASAAERYRAALDDLAQARQSADAAPVPGERRVREPETAGDAAAASDRPLAEAEARVSRKLADLLTRMGRRQQQAGNDARARDPEQAIDQYGEALDRFSEARQVEPEHAAAQQGEREVRAALEQLYLQRGREELEQGRERLARRSAEAVEPLREALADFASAQDLNPAGEEARAGAAEARRLLPDALALAGQQQMAAGDRAEARAATEALGRYQEAETSFEQALAMQPGQSEARRGLAELEPRLARMRERVSREAEAAARQNLQPSQRAATLDNLLGQVNERERPAESERQRQRGQKRPGTPRNPLDW